MIHQIHFPHLVEEEDLRFQEVSAAFLFQVCLSRALILFIQRCRVRSGLIRQEVEGAAVDGVREYLANLTQICSLHLASMTLGDLVLVEDPIDLHLANQRIFLLYYNVIESKFSYIHSFIFKSYID